MNSFRMDANTTGDISIETLCLNAHRILDGNTALAISICHFILK